MNQVCILNINRFALEMKTPLYTGPSTRSPWCPHALEGFHCIMIMDMHVRVHCLSALESVVLWRLLKSLGKPDSQSCCFWSLSMFASLEILLLTMNTFLYKPAPTFPCWLQQEASHAVGHLTNSESVCNCVFVHLALDIHNVYIVDMLL